MSEDNCSSVEALRDKLKKQKQTRIAIAAGCVLAIVCGLGANEFYRSVMVPKNKYKEAVALYQEGEFTKVYDLLDEIPNQEGVEELKKQMEDDVSYNEYLDNAVKFGFYTESAMLLADKLAVEDPKSSTYAELAENIEKAQEKMNEYAAKMEEVPEKLNELGELVIALKESCQDFVESALKLDLEELSSKKEVFQKLYQEFEQAIPEKKSFVYGIAKQTLYDFRHSNFGMTKEELVQSEDENYGLEPELISDDEIRYKSVTLANGMTGDIVYRIGALRTVMEITVEFSKETKETDIDSLLNAMYKVQLENDEIIISYNQYPAIRTGVIATEDSVILSLLPMEQKELDDYRSMQEYKTNVKDYIVVLDSELDENGYVVLSPKLYKNMDQIEIMGVQGSFMFGDFDANEVIDTMIWESDTGYSEQEFQEWLLWFEIIYGSEARIKTEEYFYKAYIWEDEENRCEVWVRRTPEHKLYIEWFRQEESDKEKLI